MAESTIFGLNTGLDTADIIDKLVALERKPIDLQESKRAIEDEKLTTFQDLKSRLKTFKSVLTTLNTSSRFIETQGEFSNNSASDNNEVVGIETTSQATSGTFSLTVNQLARETKIISEGFESKTSTL
ncbi:MAG: hypothetical protein GWM98_28785, partial [Nitrospinaceae bacterium]|nr:hypothetical protein [Nitrospinaceae bacterium]NIR57722.1 hypothetical protein [Nitrospinaceae bacterium]NIS88182.1 hypothetical protein [Nitrospinaceae bacterium]NIT85064.1 hypothetical protein [Nitrospinaceae bacterium]NIU47222.1 hypothetical protein [Nitrospinaceae bacterium]